MYEPRTKPRAHQEKGRELTRGKRLFAYLCEMGTGKSKMIIDEWAERVEQGRCHDLLILAPAGSYQNWVNELSTHLNESIFRCVRTFIWKSGLGKNASRNLDAFLKNLRWPRVLIVNIEALSTNEKIRDICVTFLSSVVGRRSMFVVDESTKIRNGQAQRTKQVMALKGYADLRRILTGLVSPRSPLDLFSQFEFLDWRILGHESIYTFKRRYCILETTQVPIGKDEKGKVKWRKIETIVAYKNLEELQAKIAPYSYRVLKKDCLDLPPKIYEKWEVELTAEQKRMYNELILFSTAELSECVHVTTNMVVTKLLRLHQLVCGHTVDEKGVEHDVPSNRISALLEVLEEHGGKAIIWSNYRREIDKIVKALEKEYGKGCAAQFHGGNKSSRIKEEKAFLNDPKCRFMVSTQSAGGLGNTWVNANLVVYFSNTYDLELRMQSEDRSHREGLKHSVTYVDLVAPRTVDEKILSALRKKINMMTLISGERYREWLI